MNLSAVSNNNHSHREFSSIRLLRTLVFAHLLILTFQIPIRAMIIDTTFIRDVLIIALAGYIFMLSAINRGFNVKWRLSLLDKFMGLYLFYGIFITVLWIISGIDTILAFREFRNHFFPFILFFIAIFFI